LIELDEVQNAFVRLIISLGGRVCLVCPQGMFVLEQKRSLIPQGKAIRGFEPKVLSELPPIKTEELLDRTIILLGVTGELNAGDFGPSYVVEITSPEDTSVGHSWLVNKASVLGKQLETEMKRGSNVFPFAASVVEMPSRQGRPYISFAPPHDPNAMNDGEAKEFVDDLYKGKKA